MEKYGRKRTAEEVQFALEEKKEVEEEEDEEEEVKVGKKKWKRGKGKQVGAEEGISGK